MRASYQVSYTVFNARILLGWFGKNFPFFFQERSDSSPTVPEIDISNPFEALTPTELAIRALDPYLRSETAQEWRLTIQNEIFQNWTLQASYIGRKQNGRTQILHGNTPFPAEGTIQSRRPNPDFGRFEIVASRGSAISHSLRPAWSRGFPAASPSAPASAGAAPSRTLPQVGSLPLPTRTI